MLHYRIRRVAEGLGAALVLLVLLATWIRV